MATHPRSCTVQIMRHHRHNEDYNDHFHGWTDAGRFPSVRSARACLADAIYSHVDRLSYCSYDLRLAFPDGTVRPLSQAQQDHAIEVAKAWQYENSIGYRLACGDAVAV